MNKKKHFFPLVLLDLDSFPSVNILTYRIYIYTETHTQLMIVTDIVP